MCALPARLSRRPGCCCRHRHRQSGAQSLASGWRPAVECNSCCRAAVLPRYAPSASESGSVSEQLQMHCPNSLSDMIC